MPKLYYSANGRVIEKMTASGSDSLNLSGNLEINGAIKAGSYQNIKGEPLSFVNPKGELSIGGITSKDNKIGINQKFPTADLHVGHSIYVGKDNEWSSRTSAESALQEQSEFKGKGFLTTPWLNASHIESINKNGDIQFYGANGKALSINKKVENETDPIVSVPGVFQAKTIRANKYMLGDKTIHDIVSEEVNKKGAEQNFITSGSEIAIKRGDKWEARLHRPSAESNNPNTYLDYQGELVLRKDSGGQGISIIDGNTIRSNMVEITGNSPHPDKGDGLIYRSDGQLQISTDDMVRLRHIGTKQTGIQFDTRPNGDIQNPNGQMKIGRQGIMFGGPNNKLEKNSAQISAGLHKSNSLDIVGMSDVAHKNRKVHVWSEGGMTINGPLNITGTLTVNGKVIA